MALNETISILEGILSVIGSILPVNHSCLTCNTSQWQRSVGMEQEGGATFSSKSLFYPNPTDSSLTDSSFKELIGVRVSDWLRVRHWNIQPSAYQLGIQQP